MRILCEILEIDDGRASPEDSFYDFGGTSLQAMRICTRIHRELGAEVAPELLFEADTFGDFVGAVAGAVSGVVVSTGEGAVAEARGNAEARPAR